MKNLTKYTPGIALLTALLVPAACNKPESLPQEEEACIRFASPVQTKATEPLDADDVISVRDWYNGTSLLIEDDLERASDASWNYASGSTYQWKSGTHLLFGWLKNSNAYSTNAFFGAGFSLSGTTLTLPAKTMNNTARQYDFLYSNVVSRSTAENDYSDVPLIFKHLFAQVAISFKVDSGSTDTEQPINLKRVYLNDTFKNKKEATIDFSKGGDATVTFTGAVADGYFADPVSFNIDPYGKTSVPIDVLAQVQSVNKVFYFVWPTPEEDLQNVIEVEYSLGTSDRTSNLSFPVGTSWEAGHKYQYTINYMGGILKINESVLPWDYVASSSTVETQSAMATWMGWDANTCSASGSNVTFISDGESGLKKIHGLFKIYAPTECTYTISLTGSDAAHFTLENGTGTIGTGTGEINPGATIDFYINAVDRPASGTYNAGLHFTVEASGRTFSVDSEIQRDGDFNLIIPSA